MAVSTPAARYLSFRPRFPERRRGRKRPCMCSQAGSTAGDPSPNSSSTVPVPFTEQRCKVARGRARRTHTEARSSAAARSSSSRAQRPERRPGPSRVLYDFEGAPDGAYPEGGLIADHAGNLYGTTWQGGSGVAPTATGSSPVAEWCLSSPDPAPDRPGGRARCFTVLKAPRLTGTSDRGTRSRS